MESRKILERYGYYLPSLANIAQTPFLSTPTLESIGASGSLVQRAYKEIKAEKFEGNIIDYLCFISLQYVLFQINPEKKDLKALEVSEGLLKSPWKNDVKNTLRIFIKNPFYLFGELNDGGKFNDKVFGILAGEWFKAITEEREQNQ